MDKWVFRGSVAAVVLLAVSGFLFRQASFVVDESELAVVTRSGDVRQSITESGRYYKVPLVDLLTYMTRQPLRLDAPPAAITTKDRKKLLVVSFGSGRIVDPGLTYETAGDERSAVDQARSIILSEMRKEIRRHDIQDAARARAAVLEQVRQAIRPQLAALGIELLELETNLSE